ncbi:hypothetical protein BUALT_Bualt03G0076200 [Buddleja alternifolia]|uniref:Senescence regulator n=1 Tax=Buddleja alternifolia TaxID=168488 RepID=A0AAV6XRV8_9LAMI|nr:hypothetical protein BUALT_Bualt03G0076200 [Buddleja alternifolia]
MAKGRKLSTSRSERFLGSFGYNHGQGTVNSASELGEEEVWSMVDNTVNGDNHSGIEDWSSRASTESNGSFSSYSTRHPPPRSGHHHQVGGLSLAFDGSSDTSSHRILHQYCPQDSVAESPRSRHMATSAPVNVPDWSKIYRVNSVESLHDPDDGLNDSSELVPPHEYLAREYARSRKIAANSVFEGVGRTLKGRDLSRVRDAVWSQTGFDG